MPLRILQAGDDLLPKICTEKGWRAETQLKWKGKIIVADLVFLKGTAGDDRFVLRDGVEYASFDGKGGSDTLNISRLSPTTDPEFGSSSFGLNMITGEFRINSRVDFSAESIENFIGSIATDLVRGNNKKNNIFGGDGSDILDGFGGADFIRGQNGNDFIKGGDGADLLFGNDGADEIFGGKHSDSIRGGDGNDTLKGEDGSDTIRGGNGRDTLEGGNGNDFLAGGNGRDVIKGGDDQDNLDGDGGADRLEGGNGDDRLSGGAGSDTFVFRTSDTNFGQSSEDTITDFDASTDKIKIVGALPGTIEVSPGSFGTSITYIDDNGRDQFIFLDFVSLSEEDINFI